MHPLFFFKEILSDHHYKLIVPVVIAFACYVVIIRNPLPSDEEMIAHLNEHRVDIEELIRRYRAYPSGPKIDHSKWRKDGDTLELLSRTRIKRIDFSAYTPWLPNPYSIEAGRKIEYETTNAKSFEIFNKYGALRIKPSPRDSFYAVHLRYSTIWKEYYYIPEKPRVENGELLWPFNIHGEYSVRRRVLLSLDSFPDKWKDYECVYRQIDPHWFLRMCNGH